MTQPTNKPGARRAAGGARRPPENMQVLAPRRISVDAFDLQYAPGHLLRRCSSRARAIFDEMIGNETGLSKQQTALLIAVAHNPSATHAQLSEETGMDRNTLADALNRLIAKGLASRERSARDARAYDIRLTAPGESLLRSIIPRSFEVQARIVEPLPPEMRPVFVQCLRLLLGLGDVEPPAPPGRRARATPRA